METNLALKLVLVQILLLNVAAEKTNLKAIYLKPRFPFPFKPISAIYDGKGYIRIIGNLYHKPSSKGHVLKYNINTNGMEKGGFSLECGRTVLHIEETGDVLCYGDGVVKWSVKPPGGISGAPAQFPSGVVLGVAVKYNQSSVLMFGGGEQCNVALQVDADRAILRTTPIIVTTSTPQAFANLCSSAAITSGTDAFLFSREMVLKLDLISMQFEIVAINKVPFKEIPSVVFGGGEFAYVIGSLNGSSTITGIFQFSLKKLEFQLLPVANIEASSLGTLDSPPAVVYVPELKRIYMFGGWSEAGNIVFRSIFGTDYDPSALFVDLTALKFAQTTTTPGKDNATTLSPYTTEN